jgi:hypothetical protein
MTTIAVTGHRGLPPATSRLVDQALRTELARHRQPLTGLSCLADGADQLFARAVLDTGGTLTVVVPADNYREALPASCHPTYDTLYAQASDVIKLDNPNSEPEAHMQASQTMLDRTDHLIAVWDGQPSRGYGGTADVVQAAQQQGIPVTIIWPNGAHRD